MREILDLERFPLDDLDSAAGAALVERCRDDLQRFGMFDLDRLVQPAALARAVAEVAPLLDERAATNRRRHNIYAEKAPAGVPKDHPALAEFETVSHTLCADQLADTVVQRLYEHPALRGFFARVMDLGEVHLMADPLARVNVMRYEAGEALNWHFDRSVFTATLLLQAPRFGGLFQYARDLRSDDDPNPEGVALLLDGEWPVETVRLMPGTMNVFQGRNTAHRVTPVGGEIPRIVAVLSYYEEPGVALSERERLGYYGRAS